MQGLGYPKPNLSHFRSIEIWDTASASEQYLSEGWLARAFAANPVPRSFAAISQVLDVSRAAAEKLYDKAIAHVAAIANTGTPLMNSAIVTVKTGNRAHANA